MLAVQVLAYCKETKVDSVGKNISRKRLVFFVVLVLYGEYILVFGGVVGKSQD